MARLREEPPGTFPEYALRALREIHEEVNDRSIGAALGRELLRGGYAVPPDRDSRGRHLAPEQLAALRFFGEFHAELWRGDDPVSPDTILNLLERNPYFFRSGYEKARAIRRLRGFALGPPERKRVAGILRAAVATGREIALPYWWRLAPLADRADADEIAREALGSGREDVRRKAVLLLLVHRGKTHRFDALLNRGWRSHRAGDWDAEERWARAEVRLQPFGERDTTASSAPTETSPPANALPSVPEDDGR